MDRVDTLIDNAAELQQQINRINQEILSLVVAILALSLGVAVLAWGMWQR